MQRRWWWGSARCQGECWPPGCGSRTRRLTAAPAIKFRPRRQCCRAHRRAHCPCADTRVTGAACARGTVALFPTGCTRGGAASRACPTGQYSGQGRTAAVLARRSHAPMYHTGNRTGPALVLGMPRRRHCQRGTGQAADQWLLRLGATLGAPAVRSSPTQVCCNKWRFTSTLRLCLRLRVYPSGPVLARRRRQSAGPATSTLPVCCSAQIISL